MSLSNKHYTDKQILDVELDIFQKQSWILVAHKIELINNNDFVTFDYIQEKIFVKNFNGIIKAYQNICLHRFNTIYEEDFGNRASSCLYHNWTYNKEGKVIASSCRNSFDKEEIEDLKLKEYKVDYCGNFIFIKLNELNSTSLSDYLGDIFSKLEYISNHFGDKIVDYKKEHKGNWKLLVENVLECYHCSSVHVNSFAKLGYGFAKPEKYGFFEGHSWCEFPKMSGLHKNKLIDKILNSRTFECDGYMHFYIYPNAFISSVEGKGFYFGFIIPQTASQTVLRIRYFSPIIEKKLTESEKNIFDFINKSSLDTLELVLNEDKQIIENIQSNLNSLPSNSPMFGLDEFRINNFHNFFSKKLNL